MGSTKSGPIYLQITHQLPQLFSWRPDTLVKAVMFFKQCEGLCQSLLVSDSRIKAKQAKVIPVTLHWKSQAWYPIILDMLKGLLSTLPPWKSLLQKGKSHKGLDITPQLAVWPVSGRNTELLAFQLKLLTNLQLPIQKNGQVDLLIAIAIPSQNPKWM